LNRDAATGQTKPRLPRAIWMLGFVSMFMDVSSEMIHSLLPVFLVSVLGAGTLTVGFIEGAGEATASISKLFSGWLSDRLGNRKLLAVIGYGLATLSKPLFALAPTADWVLLARFSDRVGKGIRGAPRDALIGDLTPASIRGAAYGLRQALDTIGAFAGPLLAILLMWWSNDHFRLVFWVALIPGAMAVAILVAGVREPQHRREGPPQRFPIRISELRRFGSGFWTVVAVGAVLTLARFSEAFLVLRANGMGLGDALVPLVLVAMNVVYSVVSYPAGALSDRVGNRAIMALGFAALIAADVVLAVAPNLWAVFAGIALWGLHMGLTQGLLSKLVAASAPESLRGSAFGVFYLVSGIALLIGNALAGGLWELVGPSWTFWAGAALTAAGIAGLAFLRDR
jgi:MFS family permease